jgi:2-dehydropantoate 2-reductase
MRIAIMGSGAIGGYFGALLSRAGQEVAFIARGAHLDAMSWKACPVTSCARGGSSGCRRPCTRWRMLA